MKRQVIIRAVLCVMIFGCIFSCMSDRKEYSRSMVTAYYKPDKISLEKYSDRGIAVRFNEASFIGGFRSEGLQKTAYDLLCEKHNDMSYNRKILIRGENPTPPNEFISADLVSVEITSDADFDVKHFAGSSLNDIIMFLAVSPKKYINSGYIDEYNWKNGSHESAVEQYFYLYYDQFADTDKVVPYHPVEKLVSDLKSEDMTLLGNGVYDNWVLFLLRFTTLPVDNKTHNITVVLSTDEGEVFSDTVQMTFN